MVSWQYRLFARFIGFLPCKTKVKLHYLRKFRRLPNLNSPKTFNEKINWRKLNERKGVLTIAADKLASKRFVEQHTTNVKIPKTLWSSSSFADFKIEDMPDNYVIKANHGSRMNLFVRDGKHFELAYLEKIRTKWFSHDQYKTLGEWAYKDIERKVFAEEFLDFKGNVPDDYKLFVYHGKVRFIQLDVGRFTEHKRNMFDSDWKDLEIDYSHERMVPVPERPAKLAAMIAEAEAIGKFFTFVRIDFYILDDEIYFGELTVYPGAGYEVFPSTKVDAMFGKPWDLNVSEEAFFEEDSVCS